MVNTLSLLAYLDPGEDKTPAWQWVLLGFVAVVVLLAVVYALTRFIAWTARR